MKYAIIALLFASLSGCVPIAAGAIGAAAAFHHDDWCKAHHMHDFGCRR